MGNECMRNIKEMIFMDVTKLNLMERLKPTEEKRKKKKSEKSESTMGIKLMIKLVGSPGLKKILYMYLPFEQANLNSVQRNLCPLARD